MTREAEIAWAAGLFEGEGCIYLDRGRHKRGTGRPLLSLGLSMTDEDVLLRFRTIVGLGRVQGPYWSKKSTKPYWTWQCRRHAEVVRVLEILLPLLGERRRSTIAASLKEYDEADARFVPKPKGTRPLPRLLPGQMELR